MSLISGLPQKSGLTALAPTGGSVSTSLLSGPTPSYTPTAPTPVSTTSRYAALDGGLRSAPGGTIGPVQSAGAAAPTREATVTPNVAPKATAPGIPNPYDQTNAWAPPSYQQDYYQGAQQRLSGPTAAQSYYAAYTPTTTQQTYFNQRQAAGLGPNSEADRLAQMQSNPLQSAAGGMLGDLTGWTNSGSQATARMQQRQGLGPDALDSQYAQTQGAFGQPTATSSALNYLAGVNPAGRIDSTYAGMANGSSPTAALQSQLQNGGPTASFLGSFNPGQSLGLQSTYDKFNALGPTNAQSFYSSTLDGSNPYYNQLKADYLKDQQRSAAARGAFVSGREMDLEQRGLARMAADEYANEGNLAAAADQANQGQNGQLLSAANSLDQNYTNRQQLQAQTGLGLANTLAGLASSREGNMTNLATSGDKNLLDLANLRLTGAGQQDTNIYNRQNLLSQEAKGLSDRDAARQNALDSLATSADQTDLTRHSTLLNAANDSDRFALDQSSQLNSLAQGSDATRSAQQTALDALAGRAGTEAYQGQQLGLQAAQAADTSQVSRENLLGQAASGASGEQANNITMRFNQAMKMGDAQAGIQAAADAAAQGVLTSSMITQINLMLAQSGIPAAQQQALMNNVLSLAGLGVKAYGAAATGGATAGV